MLTDYNDYTCEARNNATDITGKPAHVTMTVRIRGMISEPPTNIGLSASWSLLMLIFFSFLGKYAALYVFVGIIIEVVVLCAIILICERRRNKTEVDESDTDQSPDQ